MTNSPFDNFDPINSEIEYGSDRDINPKWYDGYKDWLYHKLTWFAPKSYRVKQYIIERLYQQHKNACKQGKANEAETVDLSDKGLASYPITQEDVRAFYRDLLDKEEIGCTYDTFQGKDKLTLFIKNKGITVASHRAYLLKGWGVTFGTISAIVVFLVTLSTLYKNLTTQKNQTPQQINIQLPKSDILKSTIQETTHQQMKTQIDTLQTKTVLFPDTNSKSDFSKSPKTD